VGVFATAGRVGGRAVSEPYYSQRARSVCVSLSAFFISCLLLYLFLLFSVLFYYVVVNKDEKIF